MSKPEHPLQARWRQLAQRFDGFSLRERLLVAAGALAVVVALWLLLVQDPVAERREALRAEQAAVAREQQAQQLQLDALTQRDAAGAPSSLQRQRDNLLARRDNLDERLAALSQGLVSAEQLPSLLEDVLLTTGQLELIQMRTLPVEMLSLRGINGDEGSTGVYQHSVALTLRGSYFEVLAFLQALEDLPWRFYWEQLEYAVETYPKAEVKVRVYTLSAEEGLLGV
ncbi:type II secretion system protein GspM [Marinimicrobium alkaliphilum]|uniref:type II secretion system protein GspM n=1 Tax=Marinimicrobium alkaliphilum TaxID=2202654 RepID=UPI000DBA37A2|nr:type II secretion system protein GspM [Marinimicrobium alkaliphilum]